MAAAKNDLLERKEHPKGSGIFIRPIIYTKTLSGKKRAYSAFEVSIPRKITGTKRIRTQFPDEKSAREFAAKQNRGRTDEGKGYFRATDSERAEFSAVLPRLREAGVRLTEAVDYALVHMCPKGGSVSVEAVVAELVQAKQKRMEKGTLEWDTFRDFKSKGEGFAASFPDTLLRDLLKEDIVSWLEEMEVRPRTVQNHLSIVASVLKYAVQKRYLVQSPVDYLTDEERKGLYGSDSKGKEPSILSLEEAERLLLAAHERPELTLLPAVVLGLFCGIRTTELRRLDWSNVKDGEPKPIVTIPSGIAKKRRIRNVDIPQNALAWLSLCERREGRITYSPINDDYYKRFRRLLEHLGYRTQNADGSWTSRWKVNSMRHSFGTYHYAKGGDSLETSRLLGHKSSDDVLFEHYRALANEGQGEAYFAIYPPKGRGKLVRFAG